ncbi:hypothetical protein B0H10DRAFT_1950435 [Mycena sp. CBHHK59/15]|nr:hypothetical protein B0H10DRAFT_1950435 [Mycena sp. CBHHK59/15]
MNKGLEKIGKSSFGTLYWASYSLLWCLPAFSKLITSGVINTDSSNKDKVKLAWFKHLQAYQNLEMEIQQLCTILEPIACTIKCLEGLEVTWRYISGRILSGPRTHGKPNPLQNDNQPTEYGHIFTANVPGTTNQDLWESMPMYPKVGTFLYKDLMKELQAG